MVDLHKSDGELGVDLPDPRVSADLKAVASDWVEKMRNRSGASYFRRMLKAMGEMIEEGFADFTLRDVADRAGVTDQQLHKFKNIVRDTRHEMAAKGQML